MGWLSDKLFGKKKRINQNKINDYMKPYGAMIDEQEGIARQMMDPNSMMNIAKMNMMKRNQYDMMGQQNLMQTANAISTGVSPAQMMAQQNASSNRMLGQFGQQSEQMLTSNYNQGLLGLQNVMGMRKGEGERLANSHIQQVNAHNARRQANMSMTASLAGAAMSAFSDERLKENIELVGKSKKGFNIYEFDYINKGHGKGRYRGVLSKDVPFASMKDSSGYELVNYSHPKLDVKFERIK